MNDKTESTNADFASAHQVATDRVTYNFESQASKLSLARLGIDALPESLLTTNRSSELGHIVVLDLKHNALQLLPSELFLCLTQLQEVDASENRLSYIPETIGLVTGLRKLRLRGNHVRELPAGLCRLRSLEELHLGHNYLECLPTGIAALQNLRRLDLANNRLQEIPEEAALLVALEHVDLSGNPVQRMPLSIRRLQTKGELLRCKAGRRKLVARALHVRGSVRAAFAEEALRDNL